MRDSKGQSLVEFALCIPLFLALMMGLLDGTRLLFTYNALQEAARVGARWGAVEAGRDGWGTFGAGGSITGTTSLASDPLTVNSLGITPTVAGQVSSKLIAIDHAGVELTITTPITGGYTDTGLKDSLAGNSVTVTVAYTFTPILSFGHFGIKLVGKNVQYHA